MDIHLKAKLIFLGLSLGNNFDTWGRSLVGVSLGAMVVFMIGTGYGSLVGLSMGLPLGSPPKYPNTGDALPIILLGEPLGLWFESEAARYWCT